MSYDTLNDLLNQANELNNKGNHDEAETLAKNVLEDIEKKCESTQNLTVSEREELHCAALITLSTSHWRRGEFQAALTFAQAAIDLAEEKNLSDLSEAKALGTIGIVYHHLSDYPQALAYYQKALALYEKCGSKEESAGNMCNIGNLYWNLSDYAQALTYYQKALAIYEGTGGKNGIATNLGNIGLVYLTLSDNTQALSYFQKAITIYEETGNKVGIARNLGNIGNVYSNLSDFENALIYLQKALAIFEEINNKNGCAVNLGNIGNIFYHLSDYPQSLTYYQKALAIYEDIGTKEGIANNLGFIGVLYTNSNFEGNNTEIAEEYLRRAIVIYEEIEEKMRAYHCHHSLAQLYEKEKRWEEFAFHYKRYHTQYTEVQSDAATKQAQQMEYRRKVEESERDRQVKLARFQEQEKILHNILPSQIADRMIEGEKTIADSHENVSVFFSDIVGFTKLSQQVSAQELVGMLNGLFSQFDQLARKHGLEKIKTIGDAYMAVCGAPIHVENHAERTALFALDVAELMKNYQTIAGDKVTIRIGLHTGGVVAGIIGENKFAYDMWGDAVNTASRMESHGEAGKIHVSAEFMHALSLSSPSFPMSLHFVERSEMDIKGKGTMKTYFLEHP